MNVLIADDHGLFRSGLRYLLQGLNNQLQITEVSSLENLLVSDLSDFALVLMDLRFGGKDALPLIRPLMERAPKSRIVIISAEESPDRVRQCIEEGALGFLSKSQEQDSLLPALKLVLAGGIYLPADAIRRLSSKSPTPEHADENPGSLSTLTTRQRQILNLAVIGTPNKIIGRQLDIAEGTVKAHLSKIYQLLGVRNRTEAVYLLAGEQSRLLNV